MKSQPNFRTAVLLLLLTASAMLTALNSKPADDVAVAREGTQVATEKSPAASANTNALQKASASFSGNAVYPAGTSSWNMRLQRALLFPKLTKQQQMMLMEQRMKQLKAQPSD